MKRFILLLRQLASEFDAFGDTAEGRAVFAELETIRLPLKLRGSQTVPRTAAAGAFLRAASRILLGAIRRPPRPEMPVSWPALDAAARTRLGNVLSRAVTKRFADIKQKPGRFDEPGARCHPRVRPVAAGQVCPARTVWSAYSEPFVIAPWYEGGGAPPVQTSSPRHRP